jgi:trans-2,3-dihydro-3-hydroxyanthranilate isomerase
MRELFYSVMDVFAERALEGNPLAVFHDGRGLSDEEMQALARETSLSETTFVLPGEPGEERENGVRVRIFTTEEELPFAGHPTLGTASWLYRNHPTLRGAETITLRLNVGPIVVSFGDAQTDDAGGVWARMRQNDPVFGVEHDPEEVAAVIGVKLEELLEGYAPQTVSTGNAFCIVALRSIEELAKLAIPQRESTEWLRSKQTRWFYCVAPHGDGWRARMQFYGGEDPATGSAAGPCIAWLVKCGLARSGEPVVIEQGVEMRRPSRIVAEASVEGERVHSVFISGRTIPVAEGRFFLP